MKIFANKSIWKKLVIVFVVINLFTFMAPKPVAASVGGTLAEPICNFLVGVGDGVVNILHKVIMGQDTTLVILDKEEGILEKIGGILLAGLILVAAVAYGVSNPVGAIVAIVGLVVSGVVTGGMIDGGKIFTSIVSYSLNAFSDEVAVPFYTLSPEEIFDGEIGLFNVNFFDTEKLKDSGLRVENYTNMSKEIKNISEEHKENSIEEMNNWLRSNLDSGEKIALASKMESIDKYNIDLIGYIKGGESDIEKNGMGQAQDEITKATYKIQIANISFEYIIKNDITYLDEWGTTYRKEESQSISYTYNNETTNVEGTFTNDSAVNKALWDSLQSKNLTDQIINQYKSEIVNYTDVIIANAYEKSYNERDLIIINEEDLGTTGRTTTYYYKTSSESNAIWYVLKISIVRTSNKSKWRSY